MDLNANSLPISADEIKKKSTAIIQSAAAAALTIPPPAGEIVAAAIEALQAIALGVADAVDSEFIEPLKKAVPYIDASYQTSLFEEITKNITGIVTAAVKDYAAHKLGKGADVIGIDSGAKSRTSDYTLKNVFYATGMPQWMAVGAASEMAWDQGDRPYSRMLMDELDDRVGLPRGNRDLGKAMALAYSKWDGKDGVYGDAAPPPPAEQGKGMGEFDEEWSKAPLPFSDAVLKESGGLTMAGVELYRASISQAIEEGQYKTEADLFYDWTVRPNPDKSTIRFWHSLSHDLWAKSKYYADQRKQKEQEYFKQNARPEPSSGMSNTTMLAVGAVAVVAVILLVK